MTYQVLARKWRPQNFTELIGQETITTGLRNALLEGRIAQAYLFSGIRGVGKTTAARVLAKALNCEGRDDQRADPCNECRSCLEITAGNSLDVVEVDAATYSKVEQIRELTETLRYAPVHGRHKVVVLDEVHRLSRQAFDALLKIVEEPPEHLVFIFATTELGSVPATILSRCQQFQFRRVPAAVLAPHLGVLCQRESITASDAALRMIARAGDGSVRDSIALLDQLATFGNGTIRDEDARQLLGGLDSGVFQRLLEAILTGDGGTIAELAHEIEMNGWDPANVHNQFLAYVRDGLHLAMGGKAEDVDLPRDAAETLARSAVESGYENLLRLLQLLLASEETIRRAELGALALEITWLRAAELPKLNRIEELLGGVAVPAAPAASAKPASRTPAETPVAKAPAARTPAAEAPAEKMPAEKVAPSAPAEDGDVVRQVIAELRARRPPLAVQLEQAEMVFADGRLTIRVPPGDLLESTLERQANARLLTDAAQKIGGDKTTWKIEHPRRAPPAARERAAGSEVSPGTQVVLETFQEGKIVSREPRDRSEPEA